MLWLLTFPAPTFRHRMYEAYKGTRKPMPEELREQVPLIKEVLGAMQICMVEQEGYEADDILGTFCAERARTEVSRSPSFPGTGTCCSLATGFCAGANTQDPAAEKTVIEDYHTKEVVEKYQLTPPQIIDLKSLMGDASDNIPGIPGVGEKTATKLVAAYGSLEEAHAHLEEDQAEESHGIAAGPL